MEADVVVAAGVEVMSQIPFALPANVRSGNKMGDMSAKDLLVSDGLTDVFNGYHMGVTAENVAREVNISREDQDAYALESQMKRLPRLKQEDSVVKSYQLILRLSVNLLSLLLMSILNLMQR